MMILDYQLDPADLQRAADVDMAFATGDQLDYYLFCGSIVFRVGSASFDAPWGWIPVFDFAIKINEITTALMDGEDKILEFTECEDTISFARTGGNVRIKATYAPCIADVPFEELRLIAAGFLEKVKDDLLCRFPALSENIDFKVRLASVGKD